ncbi:MAG: transposase [Planctomycetota bacterium]
MSFLHRFGSALEAHVHLHACATEGVFVPPADTARCDTPPAFLPARPITQADLAALTERVCRRVIRFLQAHSPARHRCRRRHAHVGEQRFFSRCQCSDHAQ